MLLIYNVIRFIALHSHSNIIKGSLWNLWYMIGRDWADGALVTGTMCRISDFTPDKDSYIDVNLEF